MDKIDLENVSLLAVAEKVNEIVDFVNASCKENILWLQKQSNLIKYGKYMTDEEIIKDMMNRCVLFGNEYNGGCV